MHVSNIRCDINFTRRGRNQTGPRSCLLAWKWENPESARRHHYNDPKENICRSVALSLTVWFLSLYMYISHVSHHLSFCGTIKCFAGYQFGHYLPSSTTIEIPKVSADCLRTMELQSSKIYCQTSFTYPDFPTARMTIWGRKARQQNKYSAKISM